MREIDLRSDTVTQPTQEMRDAMYSAPVGDDTYGDDPTVRNLEALAAKMAGKEAALFLASGTMGNQAAIMTHTVRGDEMILSSGSHLVMHEVGAAAILSGVVVRAIPCKDDMLTPEIIEDALRRDSLQVGHNSLICIENAMCNGKVMPLELMKACYETAKQYNLPVHIDGARVFNATVALGINLKELARYCDSIMIGLSKGLCAPLGSVLCGDTDFIEKARRNRKMLGGDMRQAGLIAACGIIGLEKMVDRLVDDHNNAKRLAELIGEIQSIKVDKESLQINMVFFELNKPKNTIAQLPALMLEKGIKMNGMAGGKFYFVTNNDVTAEDVEYVGAAMKEILA